MADGQTMDVSEALALAAQYRTAYAGAMRRPAFVRALLALAGEVVRAPAAHPCAAEPAGGVGREWRCFSCDVVFTDYREARRHFVATGPQSPAACLRAAAESQVRAATDATDALRDAIRAVAADPDVPMTHSVADAVALAASNVPQVDAARLARVRGRVAAADAEGAK